MKPHKPCQRRNLAALCATNLVNPTSHVASISFAFCGSFANLRVLALKPHTCAKTDAMKQTESFKFSSLSIRLFSKITYLVNLHLTTFRLGSQHSRGVATCRRPSQRLSRIAMSRRPSQHLSRGAMHRRPSQRLHRGATRLRPSQRLPRGATRRIPSQRLPRASSHLVTSKTAFEGGLILPCFRVNRL